MDATEDEPTSFVYLSPDALSNPSKLLVLIQGSGVVRAGQWARRLIINQDLDSGTQIPFITRAMAVGETTKEVEASDSEAELIFWSLIQEVVFPSFIKGDMWSECIEDKKMLLYGLFKTHSIFFPPFF